MDFKNKVLLTFAISFLGATAFSTEQNNAASNVAENITVTDSNSINKSANAGKTSLNEALTEQPIQTETVHDANAQNVSVTPSKGDPTDLLLKSTALSTTVIDGMSQLAVSTIKLLTDETMKVLSSLKNAGYEYILLPDGSKKLINEDILKKASAFNIQEFDKRNKSYGTLGLEAAS